MQEDGGSIWVFNYLIQGHWSETRVLFLSPQTLGDLQKIPSTFCFVILIFLIKLDQWVFDSRNGGPKGLFPWCLPKQLFWNTRRVCERENAVGVQRDYKVIKIPCVRLCIFFGRASRLLLINIVNFLSRWTGPLCEQIAQGDKCS